MFLLWVRKGRVKSLSRVELRDGERVIARGNVRLARSQRRAKHKTRRLESIRYKAAPVYTSLQTRDDAQRQTISLTKLGNVRLWGMRQPNLYTVHVQLLLDGQAIDEDTRRVGFREAVFTEHGFSLNGTIVKLRGLDRHQTFPYVGQAMPARVQRQDARILRQSLHCNIVGHLTIRNPVISLTVRRDRVVWCWKRFRMAAYRG